MWRTLDCAVQAQVLPGVIVLSLAKTLYGYVRCKMVNTCALLVLLSQALLSQVGPLLFFVLFFDVTSTVAVLY